MLSGTDELQKAASGRSLRTLSHHHPTPGRRDNDRNSAAESNQRQRHPYPTPFYPRFHTPSAITITARTKQKDTDQDIHHRSAPGFHLLLLISASRPWPSQLFGPSLQICQMLQHGYDPFLMNLKNCYFHWLVGQKPFNRYPRTLRPLRTASSATSVNLLRTSPFCHSVHLLFIL